MANNRILLVEDESSLAVGLEFNLKEEGYNVKWVDDGQKAVDAFEAEDFDLIILDIMLPYLDGFQVAEKIRQKNQRLPILMLTAKDKVNDRLQGLETGADDYLTKPFHLEELLLRVKRMLERKSWYSEINEADFTIYSFGSNTINFNDFKCTSGDREYPLTHQEIELLKFMIANEGKLLSRKEILEKVWHISSKIETRTIDNFIVRFRKYFNSDGKKHEYFKTIRGVGYIFNSEG